MLFEILYSQNSTKFEDKSLDFHTWLSRIAKNKRKMFKISLMPYLAHSQIWPNIPTDDSHLGYISKLTQKLLLVHTFPPVRRVHPVRYWSALPELMLQAMHD